MKQVIVLRILSGLFLIIAVILFILYFTCQYNIFWFSVPIACATVLNLIASIKFLNMQKKNKEKTTVNKDNLNK